MWAGISVVWQSFQEGVISIAVLNTSYSMCISPQTPSYAVISSVSIILDNSFIEARILKKPRFLALVQCDRKLRLCGWLSVTTNSNRLEQESGENFVEKRGWHWELTRFELEIWSGSEKDRY
jgi:hypothetical protein